MASREGERLGNYRLIKLLGQGGFAEVYLGEDLIHRKNVAIKILKTKLTISTLRDLINEARTSRLNHPHIIPIRDFSVEGDTSFLVMDYAPNGSLRQRHPKGSRVPLETVVSYVKQIAGALLYAHNERMIHRDVKPENMLIDGNGQILLSDFGIAATDVSSPIGLSEMMGTAKYMAPEQIQVHSRPLPATDQYSLAIVVYEWLCGTTPFDGTPLEIITKQIREAPPSLHEIVPDIPLVVEQVINKALSKEPKDRFDTVQEFAKALETAYQFVEVLGKVNPPPTPPPKAPIDPAPPIPNGEDQPFRTIELPLTQPPVPHKELLVLQRMHPLFLVFVSVLILSLLGNILISIALWRITSSNPVPNHLASSAHTSLVVNAPDQEHEPIGVSDGSYTFDTKRSDSDLRHQAASKLKAGDAARAEELWRQAIARDNTDPEALIYLEDQRIIDSGSPYITLVVGTVLTGSRASLGRDILQGAYVAQREFNHCTRPHCTQLRLLIANAGSGEKTSDGVAYADYVMGQIAALKQSNDPSIMGIIGWPLSSYSLYSQTVLAAAHIPLISPTPLINISTDTPQYVFSIAPSNEDQANVGANYIKQFLRPTHLALFVDPSDPYSEKLSESFAKHSASDEYNIIKESYTTGQVGSLLSPLHDALSHNVDLIYFAGYASDLGSLLSYLPTVCPAFDCQDLKIFANDAFYDAGNYPASALQNFSRLYFTAFAYSNEWSVLAHSPSQPPFFQEYQQDFDSGHHQPEGTYGANLANGNVIMSYDATSVLLTAYSIASNNKQNPTSEDVQAALTGFNGHQAVQGLSGRISFGADGTVTNKEVLVLHFDQNKKVDYSQANGCFLKPLPTATDTNCS